MHLSSVSGPRFHPPFFGKVAVWLILVTFLLFPSLCKAQSFATGAVDLGDGSSNVFSAADVGPDGKFYVLWKDGNSNNSVSLTTPRFKLLRWEADTSTWTTLGTILGNTATFPSIISDNVYSVFGDRMGLKVDSQGRFHIAIHVYYTYGAAIVYGTSTTGSSWSFTNIETNNNVTNYTLSDPQIDLDPDERPHVVLRVSDSSNSDAAQRPTRIRRHVFNGTSWAGETVYSRTGSNNAINGGVGYAIDSLGKGHLAIPVESNGSGTDASLYYLNNSTGSWSTPVNLAAGASSNAAVVSLDLAVDPQDKIHIVRRDLGYNLHHHTNASGTWEGAQINGSLQGSIDYNGLTVNSLGDLLLAYNEHTGTNVGSVRYACLFKAASSWQTGAVMSGNNRTGQYFSLAFKGDRTAMILFDHFSGTGSPSYGPPNNPRELHYATAVILPPVTDPTLTVSEAEVLTSDSARLDGEVAMEGNSPVTERGFVFAHASVSDPEIGAAGVTQVADSGSGVGSFSKVLSGLVSNTAYVFRAYAIDEDGTYYSPVATFSTNLAPVITSNGGTSSASVSVAENSSAVTTVSATDADAGHTLSYGISGGTDSGRFAIDSSSGVLTFVAPPDFEAPADADADNVYQIVVTATDNGNTPKSATQTLTVTVTNLLDNGALVLEQADGSEVAGGGTVDFGSLTLGQVAELTFTLRSVGEADLDLPDGMALGGASPSAFSLVGSIPESLATGSSVTFTVRFSPFTGGSHTAALSVATNDTRAGKSPHVLNLTGTGLTASTLASYANAANQVRGGWINGTDFTIGAVTTNWPSAESPDKAVDGNTATKFLALRNNNVGLILSPTNASVAFNRLSLSTANDFSERDPASYVIYGSPTVLTGTSGTNLPLAGLTQLASGTIVLPANRTTGPTVVQFANTTAYASYIVAFPTVRSTSSNTMTQISEVQLSQGMNPTYAVAMTDARGGQLSSSTFTFGSIGSSNPGTNWNANESPDQALDGSVATKYLIFRNTGAGLIASPQAGAAPVNRLSFWTANDFAERDPLTYEVYGFATAVTARSGTLDVGTGGTLLGSGTLALSATRGAGPETVTFDNTTAYASYLVVFPTVKNSPSTTITQIAEVQFGYNGVPALTLPAGVTMPAGEVWTARESERDWICIASSSDGTKLAAIDEYDGQIYTSSDSGVTWTPRGSGYSWSFVASSADGTKLAAVTDGGQIYTSSNSGETWTARDSDREWESITSSSDGTKLAAVAWVDSIYTSINSGGAWVPRGDERRWASITSSADGTKLAAGTRNDRIYTSTNSGETWTARGDVGDWISITSSADGTKLAAVAYGGHIYTSSDSGETWTARESERDWSSIASSSDGTKLAAVGWNSKTYTSDDSGLTWTARGDQQGWTSIASSADGTKLAAVEYGGKIYTSSVFTAAYTITVAEDSGSYSEAAFATDITPGLGDVGQTVSLATTNDNNALFSAQPVIAADGTLTFTPASNASGTATVTVIATDSTGLTSVPRSFVIEVTSVIDAPILAAPTFSDVSAYSATMHGEVLNAAVADYSGKAIMYAPTAANSTLEYYASGAVTIPLSDSPFSTTRTNLLASGTQYSVRSCAFGPAGMIYSEVSTFTTAQGAPVILDNTAGLSSSLANQGGGFLSPDQAIGYSFTTGSQPVSLSTVTLGLNASGSVAIRLRLFESSSDSLPTGEPLRVHEEPARAFGNSGVYATIPLSDWQLSANHSYTIMVDVTAESAVWRKFDSSQAFESSAGWTTNAVVFDNYAGLNKYGTSAYPLVIQMTGESSGGAVAPDAPTALVATAGDGQVSVAFTAGADGGSAITNYEFSTNDGTSWTAFDPAVTTSPAVITGLTNGTAYSIRLRAVNTAGNGTASDAVSSTPVDPPIVFRAASKAAAMTSISVSKMTSKAGGVLGTTVSVASVAATSEQGATVALAGSAIQYTPASGFSGVDRFRVTFTSSAGTIVGLVEMTTAAPSHLSNPARLTPLSGGRMGIQFNGIPGVAYQLQRSTDLSSWTTIATITAGSRGEIAFTDDNPPAPNGFYRLSHP